jgi:hypothetical protein
MFSDEDLVHRYTRTDALGDGVLVDVSAVAREAGLRFPVSLTRMVWENRIAVPRGRAVPGRARLAVGRAVAAGLCRAAG